MRSLTTMLSLIPSCSPASFARCVSGVTPMARTTRSACSGCSSLSSTRIVSPFSSNPSTVRPRRSFTPCFLISLWINDAISASNGFINCFGRWTIVTSMPRSFRFSANSSPIKPPPANTADVGFFVSIYFFKRKVSSTVRRVNTFSISIPGSFGCVGFAPGERINLS